MAMNSIGKELAPDFAELKEKVISECQASLDKVTDPEDYYDALQDGIAAALLSSKKTEDTLISPKLLIWDLLIFRNYHKHHNNAFCIILQSLQTIAV